jgi:hypothetical protein
MTTRTKKQLTIVERLAALEEALGALQATAERECDDWRADGAEAQLSAAETAAEIEATYANKLGALRQRVATIRSLLGG